MCSITLSILVISHNQKELLRRCITSLLQQQLSCSYEIIISDDRSTDGTWELIEAYQQKYPDLIFGYQCNSDECNPSMTSERAGYNRINGYRHVRGKYLIHVDGDDYYRGTDVFSKQVEILEKHPECTICCQNFIYHKNGYNIDENESAFTQNVFIDEKVISVDEFINQVGYIHSSACCMRNNTDLIINTLTANVYDDIDIIYQHIKDGKIILVDKCDFVYVQYNHYTASKFSKIDQQVCWLYQLAIPLVAPQCTGSFFREGLLHILSVVDLARNKVLLEQNTVNYLSRLPAFLFQSFDNRYSMKNRIRLNVIWFWIRVIKKFHLDSDLVYKILYKLIVSNTLPLNINFKRLE